MENFTGRTIVHTGPRNVICAGAMDTSLTDQKRPRRSYVKTTRTQAEDENVQKYVTVKIGDKDIRLQLDSGSD